MPRNNPAASANARQVRLLRSGRHQVVRIPRTFELPGTDATIRKEGNRIILEPLTKPSLAALLDSWTTIDTDWPEIPDVPPRPVDPD
jgi:antitoxin VapB